jgi:hypothetical protein
VIAQIADVCQVLNGAPFRNLNHAGYLKRIIQVTNARVFLRNSYRMITAHLP